MSSITNLQKLIELCESRLEHCKEYVEIAEDENEEYWVYPSSAQCLYHQILGDAYLKLCKDITANESEPGKEQEAYAKMCLTVLETGMELAGNTLQIVDRKLCHLKPIV